jgi:predicted butyrate kinase (DUF1464 family)
MAQQAAFSFPCRKGITVNYVLLIKTFIAAVKSIETLMPDSKGKEKFDAAIALVEGVIGDVQPMLPALEAVATMVVNGLRASGVFKAKTPAA